MPHHPPHRSRDLSETDRDAVVDTKLKSLFFLCQAACRHMFGQGRGKIIDIVSLLRFQGGIRVPGGGAYCPASAGSDHVRDHIRAVDVSRLGR